MQWWEHSGCAGATGLLPFQSCLTRGALRMSWETWDILSFLLRTWVDMLNERVVVRERVGRGMIERWPSTPVWAWRGEGHPSGSVHFLTSVPECALSSDPLGPLDRVDGSGELG